MDNKNIFASNLKRQMEEKGVSRKEVSAAIGVSYYTFTDWVKGKKYPRMDKVDLLCNYFGITKTKLIERDTDISQIEKAEKHVEMIMDADFSELFEDFKRLNPAQKEMIKTLVRDLARKEP